MVMLGYMGCGNVGCLSCGFVSNGSLIMYHALTQKHRNTETHTHFSSRTTMVKTQKRVFHSENFLRISVLC